MDLFFSFKYCQDSLIKYTQTFKDIRESSAIKTQEQHPLLQTNKFKIERLSDQAVIVKHFRTLSTTKTQMYTLLKTNWKKITLDCFDSFHCKARLLQIRRS